MSNHLHVVLYIDVVKANSWSDREVIEQWHQLFNGTQTDVLGSQRDFFKALKRLGPNIIKGAETLMWLFPRSQQ